MKGKIVTIGIIAITLTMFFSSFTTAGGTGLSAKGGRNFSLKFLNTYSSEIYDVKWYVNCTKDFGFVTPLGDFSGELGVIPPDSEYELTKINFFGLGRLKLSTSCNYEMGGYPGGHGSVGLSFDLYVIGPFVLVWFGEWVFFPWQK